jgi:hypothetical protein
MASLATSFLGLFRRKPTKVYMTHSERLHFIGRVRAMRSQKIRETLRSTKPQHTNLSTK